MRASPVVGAHLVCARLSRECHSNGRTRGAPLQAGLSPEMILR